ncbi:uncharacterized protein BP5553_01699 [Venustampulla echinocandica]|uniref:Uncharacterized protein n=1 Tax=Venustampulla echinocandica TaxID=2656787 RepID=A0A370U1R4_9HELO|nr:uncharacterized protein BP5553_01699 [Venustampulla echinocandica]RDL41720.1 hypothetical protein BP5553_01699 [Venustampulla echinocandica]
MKLPPPDKDISKTDLWPTAPPGTESLSHRIIEARTDILLAMIQEIRLDTASIKTLLVSQQRRRSSAGTPANPSDLNEAYGEHMSTLDDAERAQIIQNLVETTTLTEAIQFALTLYMEKNKAIYARRCKGTIMGGEAVKDLISKHCMSLEEEERKQLDDWDQNKWSGSFLDAQRRMKKKGDKQVGEKAKEKENTEAEAEVVGETSRQASKRRRQQISDSEDEEI